MAADDLPELPPADARSTAVWRQWLASLASDAEAALAAAIAYRDMDAASREKWLSSLSHDAEQVDVPLVALYAPLLAVEDDPGRRKRLIEALGEGSEAGQARNLQIAFKGWSTSTQIFVLVLPLYLDFVQVLACAVRGGCFEWVRHDPIVNAAHAPRDGERLDGVRLEVIPIKAVIDELAAAVLSHRRHGRPLPEALEVLAGLLVPEGA